MSQPNTENYFEGFPKSITNYSSVVSWLTGQNSTWTLRVWVFVEPHEDFERNLLNGKVHDPFLLVESEPDVHMCREYIYGGGVLAYTVVIFGLVDPFFCMPAMRV